jgi:hypothetical protein
MQIICESRIDDEFQGWDGDNYYQLANGEIWQQAQYKYSYHYAYRPNARILSDGSRFFLEVEEMSEPVEVKRSQSVIYIYDGHGRPVGFWKGKYIFLLNGKPIGQLRGTHVHKLSGEYIGELYKDMVVDKHLGNRGNIGNSGNPGHAGSHGNPGNRGSRNIGYPDVFNKLIE